jgi:hypothetical protein
MACGKPMIRGVAIPQVSWTRSMEREMGGVGSSNSEVNKQKFMFGIPQIDRIARNLENIEETSSIPSRKHVSIPGGCYTLVNGSW